MSQTLVTLIQDIKYSRLSANRFLETYTYSAKVRYLKKSNKKIAASQRFRANYFVKFDIHCIKTDGFLMR